MSKKNTPVIKVDPKFMDDFINDIKIKRQNLFPKEKLKPQTPRRLTLALTRHKLFNEIKKDIINADLI